jgi:hypothetical protein
MKTKLGFSVLLTFTFCLLSSQVPQGFNYQAIARDAAGAVIADHLLPARITIQTSLTGGTTIWQETHSVTTDKFGVMVLVIGTGTRTGGSVALFSDIPWGTQNMFLKTEIDAGSGFIYMGTTQLWTVPYSMVADELGGAIDKLLVTGKTTSMTEPLFEVKNNAGQTIFAVFNEGVRIYVDNGKKGAKGGFSIGGFGDAKAPSQPLFVVDPDSIRAYLDPAPLKGAKGGFSIGGFGMAKGGDEYLRVTRDSTRIYINDLPTGKGAKGGFSIGGFGSAKASYSFLKVDESTFKGGKVEYIKLTSLNTFIGDQAGINNISSGDNGSYNSFIGYQSGLNNTSGHHNTYIGWRSGYNVGPNAHYNIFIGNSSGYNNAGSSNIFVGDRSGNRNTSGSQNVFIGTFAGSKNKTGNNNMFIGSGAGRRDSSGGNNTFLGTSAGEWNINGNSNTYIGWLAGGSNDNSSNVMIGTETGLFSTTATNNVFVGYRAGYSSFPGGSNSVFIGNQAGYYETTSNRLYITNTSGANLADGKSKALIYGEFDNKTVTINDVITLTPRATVPANPVNGMIYVGTDGLIHCYLNGWKLLYTY